MKKVLRTDIEMSVPNEEIEIFNGVVTINNRLADARIFHQWFPFDQTKLRIDDYPGSFIDFSDGYSDVVLSDGSLARFLITNVSEGESISVAGTLVSELLKEEFCLDENIKRIDFSLINFREYFGDVFEFKPNSWITGELLFRSIECSLLIQSNCNQKLTKKLLSEYGGYFITNLGEMAFYTPKSSQSAEYYRKRVSTFLSFLNGRRCGPRFLKGYSNKGEELFRDFTPYFADQHKYVQSWLPFKLEASFFKLWDSYLELTKGDDEFEKIDLVIHWYLEALNNSGYANGSIILLQSAYEILFSWLSEEMGKVEKIGKSNKEKNYASNKIRSLHVKYDIPLNFPPLYDDTFTAFDLEKEEDFAYVFPQVRNAFVHYSESKKLDLDRIGRNYWPLLNTGIFYIEILILRILGYDGRIRSRVMKSGYPGERQVSILDPFIEIPS